MDDIEQMLSDCESALDIDRAHGGPGYSTWGKEFIESIKDQYEERGRLSQKQLDKLNELWERI